MRAPTVFTSDAYDQYIGGVSEKILENRPSHIELSQMRRISPLLEGSVFDNIIDTATPLWKRVKYLEESDGDGITMDRYTVALASDLSRWLLVEFLRYERVWKKVASSWGDLNELIVALLKLYEGAES